MRPRTLAISPSYAAVVRGIRELHKLAVAGHDDSPEADLIRDVTDAPWEGLSAIERKRAGGLSEDLYSICGAKADSPREMDPQAQARLNDAIEARERGEWDRSLELLRQWSPYLAPAVVSYLRGSIWDQAGDPQTAVLFYEHACQLEPDNGNYEAVLLPTLLAVDPMGAQLRAERILDSPNSRPPVAVVQAIAVMFEWIRSLPESEAPQEFRNVIPVLENTLSRIEVGGEDIDRGSHVMALTLAGFAHEFLGETQVAIDYYTRGLRIDPYHDALLVARGMLLYGRSSDTIADFALAVRNGSSIVWPYFFLAHHYLVSGRFENCVAMCDRGLHLSALAGVKSELTEWLAISQAELRFPAEIVRRTFEQAIRLDPSNERAQQNLSAFDAEQPSLKRPWAATRSEAEIRVLGQADRRYSMAA